jgi:enoyl-CoA hydratase
LRGRGSTDGDDAISPEERRPLSESRLRIIHDGPLAILTLDHPPLNLFDRSVMDELGERVDELEGAPPRALLVEAKGRFVSAGVDVAVFNGLSPSDAAKLWEELLAVIKRIERLPLPCVFAAHALTLTAAFEVALACDLIVAARSAKFGLVETVVGLSPSMGGPQRLADRAGPGRARELVMTGELFDAETLMSWGVINRVWDDGEFVASARDFALKLANGPTLAHSATKRIIAAQVQSGVAAADEQVPEIVGPLFATEDLTGAVRSFLERGPGHATFTGR